MVALGNICSFQNGGTPTKEKKHFFEGDIPWITSADIIGPVAQEARSFITAEAVQRSATNKVSKGTVLLVTRTGVGKVATAGRDLCFSQDITAIIPNSTLDSGYLVHFLRTKQNYFEQNARGATIKGVTRDVVADLEIPLPPLPEQRRIAAILDKADALRAKRREALAQIDRLTQSIFLEMFGDPVTNSMGWPLVTIGDLIESATYGTSEKSGPNGQFPVLRMNNLTRTGHIDLSNLKYMDMDESDHERYLLKAQDVLFNRTNSAELVGKTAIFREKETMAYAGYIIRLRTNAQNDPEYLAGFLNTDYAKRVLRGMCKSIIGMANINAKEVRSIKIGRPPLDIQRTYGASMASIVQIRKTYKTLQVTTDTLFASLQHRAFRGEL